MHFSLLFLLFSSFLVLNQSEPTQRWLVEISDTGDSCFRNWLDENEYPRAGLVKKLPVGNWYVIEIPGSLNPSFDKLPCVMTKLVDHKIEWRNTFPNDPAFINQDDMTLIDMPEAWDIAQGGLTSRGDTIVVALIDNGYQIDHEDLFQNIWYNHDEVPEDSVDNDGNGYIDDHVGVNVSTGTDGHAALNHGTAVAGIVGARGNNNKGVAGVNWNVKMMLVSGADFESELIEAYEYIVDMRKRYRLSNGEEGAFVVATNLSGGINNEFAEDHPIWCGMYDQLGAEGILSVTSAPNVSISVDVEGDMPTTCSSEYMIAVTNVDLTDVIVGNAGFGIQSIDIGAPGHGTITVALNDMYKEFPGTSAAAPHVTGVIALMYSTPCTAFLNGLSTDPAGIARKVRDIIFETGDDNPSLEGLTVLGKRINAAAAMEATMEGGCNNPAPNRVSITSVSPNPSPGETLIYFSVEGDTSTAYLELYTVTGALLNKFLINGAEYQQGFIRLNTPPLAAGIYLITVRNNKEKDTARIFVY